MLYQQGPACPWDPRGTSSHVQIPDRIWRDSWKASTCLKCSPVVCSSNTDEIRCRHRAVGGPVSRDGPSTIYASTHGATMGGATKSNKPVRFDSFAWIFSGAMSRRSIPQTCMNITPPSPSDLCAIIRNDGRMRLCKVAALIETGRPGSTTRSSANLAAIVKK